MMEEIIEKYALENALKYDGKANMGSVIGSVIREKPDVKKDMASFKKKVQEIVSEVNSMSLEDQEARIKEIAPELLEKEAEEHDIFENFEPEGDVVTGFPPEPSKYPHIGHAKSILINYEYAKRHDGKFIIRFEDTNPELAKEEYYQIHLDDYKWLGVEPDEVQYASDYMEKYYSLAENLIKNGKAYVCTSPQEEISDMRRNSEPIPDRNNSIEENENMWKKMLEGELEDAVLLAKIDLEHKNSVMRDPTLFRIIEEEHARQGNKYRVWPTYDFENAVMDSISGITMRFRTKEFEMRTELQRWLQKEMELRVTKTYEFARFELEGVLTSGRKIREKIDEGDLRGWDDPSLATLASLRRRGFKPEAIKEFVLGTGISKTEATLTWDDLIVHSRRVLDDEADRYSFIREPVKVKIEGAPEQNIELNLHPEHRKGGRPMKTHEEFYINKKDYEGLEDGKLYRFMECLNFKKEGAKLVFHSKEYKDYKDKGDGIMNFLPATEELLEAEVLMPDKTTVEGLIEQNAKNIKEGEVVQLERFGFTRLDSKGEKLSFWYTHS